MVEPTMIPPAMERAEALSVIGHINAFIQSQPWLDFDVVEYRHARLVVGGALSSSYSPDIEIEFRDVFFMSLPMAWHTDTSTPPLSLVEGDEARELNLRFHAEQGHHIFQFLSEEDPRMPCHVCAASIKFRIPKQTQD
ncbi:MAG TPA: hypothetical protein VGE64_07220 [Xanthomonadaceae bacterium]